MTFDINWLLHVFAAQAMQLLPRLVGALVVGYLGLKLEPRARRWLVSFFDRVEYDLALEKFIISLFGLVYKALLVLVVVSITGVETGSLIAAFGALGFAVGLALQGSMSNFASGMLLLFFKPITVGEYIKVAEQSGTVRQIAIFTTTLVTPTNELVIIPNSEITNSPIINFSRLGRRRLDLTIPVSYQSDIRAVKKIIAQVIKNTELALHEPTPVIAVDSLGDLSIDFTVRVWSESRFYLQLKFYLLEQIKLSLAEAGIEIPYPNQSIRIKK